MSHGSPTSAKFPDFSILPNRQTGKALPVSGLAKFACIMLVVFSAAFMQVPAIDLAVSNVFFAPDDGFALTGNEGLKALRSASSALTVGIASLAVLAIFVPAIFPRWSGMIRPSQGVFLLTTLTVGPGIIVNSVLKNHWGRARPRDTLELGGDWPFTPAWANVDHCSGNCSFVSGEASAVFWLVALACIAPKSWRLPVVAVALMFAGAVSIGRLAVGAHYLSDVVIAWAITLLVVAIGRWLLLDRHRAEAIDTALTGILQLKYRARAALPNKAGGDKA